MPDFDLIVVGGGWAGCAAAVTASRRGMTTLLLEQGHQWGGRATSFLDPHSGELVDNGQHLFLGAYHETRALLEDLATAPWLEFHQPLRVPYLMADGRVELLQASRWPGPLALGTGLLGFGPLNAQDKRSLIRLGWHGGPALLGAAVGMPPQRSSSISVAQWLKECGQSERLIQLLWEPMVLAALNARPSQARAKEFLAVLGQGFLRGGETAALGRAKAPLAKLLAPLPKLLEPQGSEALLHTTVEKVEPIDKGKGGWHVTVQEGQAVKAKHLILALPARLAARVCGPQLAADLGLEREAQRPLSPIVSVLMWSDTPLLPEPLLAFGPQSDGRQAKFHWGFSDPVSNGGEGASGVAWRTCLTASAADSLAVEPIADVIKAAQGFLASRGRPFSSTRTVVLRERSATPRFEPEGPARLPQATPFKGLALAGDYTETGLPATIEGAVRSGKMAFRALI